jgi:hypothetical protein
MPRTGRKHSGTGIYHVMLRGINRQDIFEEPEDHWGVERESKTCPYDSPRISSLPLLSV